MAIEHWKGRGVDVNRDLKAINVDHLVKKILIIVLAKAAQERILMSIPRSKKTGDVTTGSEVIGRFCYGI
jgi:hypothetical protein